MPVMAIAIVFIEGPVKRLIFVICDFKTLVFWQSLYFQQYA
jgi:hypothetical protein